MQYQRPTIQPNADGTTVTIVRAVPLAEYPPENLASELVFLGRIMGRLTQEGGGYFTRSQMQDLGDQTMELAHFVSDQIRRAGVQPDRPVVQAFVVRDVHRVVSEAEARITTAPVPSRLQDMPVAAVDPPVVPDGNAAMRAVIHHRIQALRESAVSLVNHNLAPIASEIRRLETDEFRYNVLSMIARREADLAEPNISPERRDTLMQELAAYRVLSRDY
jgi:hypothetical protein